MYRQVLLRGEPPRSPAGWLCFVPPLAADGQRPAPASPSSAAGPGGWADGARLCGARLQDVQGVSLPDAGW